MSTRPSNQYYPREWRLIVGVRNGRGMAAVEDFEHESHLPHPEAVEEALNVLQQAREAGKL